MKYTPENLKRWSLPESYAGATWEGWLIAPCGIHRGSDCLSESNYTAQAEALKPEEPETEKWGRILPGQEGKVLSVRENHWAVGWVEWVAIHESNAEALRIADGLARSLKSYPVLDEMDWIKREEKEAAEVWRNCYRESERIEYVRKHRGEFNFQGFSDLLGCIRGKYFAGYASELLH